jgi:alkylation response protein AidB-like acyl-CoA dehydrogenase
MRRALYTDDHEQYRETVREFFAREVTPHFLDWEQAKLIDPKVFRAAAAQGIYGLAVPEEYGGAGETDYRYRMVVNEEAARVGATSFNMTLGLQDDLVLAYLLDLTTENQKKRWLVPFTRGELLGALAMTEPGTGSDLQGIRTAAHRDGTGPDADWLLTGQKTFISSATSADFVIVAARTDPDAGSRGFSLLVVERGMAGFTRGRKLDKVGLHGQDTGELYFDNVRVPAENLIGTEGHGMAHLMSHLPQERLGIIASAYTVARAFVDGRVQTIYGGTTEIMKEIIGRDIAQRARP